MSAKEKVSRPGLDRFRDRPHNFVTNLALSISSASDEDLDLIDLALRELQKQIDAYNERMRLASTL